MEVSKIEERANELFCDKDGYVRDMIDDYKRLGYIQGATDQQKIDIEKAYSIFKELLDEYYAEKDGTEKYIITFEQFKEEMEE